MVRRIYQLENAAHQAQIAPDSKMALRVFAFRVLTIDAKRFADALRNDPDNRSTS